ncbi:cysteine--tRNA ligase [Pseudomonas abyssi]|uniref:Cysteine--tRNA ligase n=1 Tax=Pseudomonas abyssi TaxID=170540 RepID=A0A395R3D3_9PSED|nr:cysteine--tRNA ligase [Halopseudomonas gallaeciensis]RGP54309.1 cysteine--tRNA ligase [Halopseudomonas gallaeciensis]
MSLPLVLHDTLTRSRKPVTTSTADRVTLYVCGPTVYNYAHIGNARPAVVFDLLARVLRCHYREVVYASNFTDVDDKINAAAAAEGVSISVISERYIAAYQQDMRSLGVQTPDLQPRVTEHIPDIIALIERLLERGHAYLAEGHVLFNVPSFADYGQLSGRSPQDMLAGARVEVAPYKRDPMDFVLWKPSVPQQPGWDSPWGRGRPGWHIECSAMIGRHLGPTIDIHGGGQDLIFPHHENEVAQGTCANGQLYCQHWVHNSFVTVDGQKMSKSLGNVLLVRDLLELAPGEAIRLALFSTHYRRPLNWSTERLLDAKRTLARFYRSLAAVAELETPQNMPVDGGVLLALSSDLNVHAALERLNQLRKELDTAASPAARALAKGRLLASAALLGLLQQPPAEALAQLQASEAEPALPAAEIDALVAAREQARQQGDYARADALRAQLNEAGVVLHDAPTGSRWRLAGEAQL